MRYKLVLDYDGSKFFGWQKQPSLRTVQGEVELALKKLTMQERAIVGSGRTDAGVHALAQVAHFDLDGSFDCRKLVSGLNYFLPQDIRIMSAQEVGDDFHARYGARKKTYVYLMYPSAVDRAVFFRRAVRVAPDIDFGAMKESAELFVGEKDFASFCTTGSDNKTTVREVFSAQVRKKDGLIIFEVSSNGFLYNMVRIMAKVLMDAGAGKLTKGQVQEIIDAKDRNRVKGVASGEGLYLKEVFYP